VTQCGQPHEAPGLAYLGLCVADDGHDGPHEFTGPIEGTVISVTLGDGWTRTRTDDRPEHLLEPGLKDVLEGLGRALGTGPEADDWPDQPEGGYTVTPPAVRPSEPPC
jgi:hypothetical protein